MRAPSSSRDVGRDGCVVELAKLGGLGLVLRDARAPRVVAWVRRRVAGLKPAVAFEWVGLELREHRCHVAQVVGGGLAGERVVLGVAVAAVELGEPHQLAKRRVDVVQQSRNVAVASGGRAVALICEGARATAGQHERVR